MMAIELAQMNDLEDIYRLICDMENTKLDKTKFSEIFQSYLSDKRIYCLVVKMDERVIGCLNLRMELQLHHTEKIAEIMELAVDAECRSQGIGKQLFDKAQDIARKNHCVQIEVCCNMLRERAHKFYIKQGMNKTHYKLTKPLDGRIFSENKLGI